MAPRSRNVNPGDRGATSAEERALINTIYAGQGRVVGMDALCEASGLEPDQIKKMLKRIPPRARRGTAPRIIGVPRLGYRFEREAE